MTIPLLPPQPNPHWPGLIEEARRQADERDETTVTQSLREARARMSAGGEPPPDPPQPIHAGDPLFTPSTFVRSGETAPTPEPATQTATAPRPSQTDTSPLPQMLRTSGFERGSRTTPHGQSDDGTPAGNPLSWPRRLTTSVVQLAAMPLAQIAAVAILLAGSYLGMSGDSTGPSRTHSTASVLGLVGQPPQGLLATAEGRTSGERSRTLLSGDGAAAMTELAAHQAEDRTPDEPATPGAGTVTASPETIGLYSRVQPTRPLSDRLTTTPGALLPLKDLIDDRAPSLAVVIVRGLPAGFSLTAANRSADGGWVVGLDALTTAGLAIPTDAAGEVALQIESIDLAARSLGERPLRLDISVPRSNPAPETDRIAGWLLRGQALVAAGDVPAARLLLLRAAEAGDGHAAHTLATTYDDKALRQRGAVFVTADPIRARYWYAQAAAAGVAEAREALSRLGAVATADEADPLP